MLGALVLAPGPLEGQGSEVRVAWNNAQGGFCIWYLSDPELAQELVPEGTRLRMATEMSGLTSSLSQVIVDEPRFAAWIPGVVCVGLYEAVAGRAGQFEAEPDQPLLVSLWAIAAHEPRGQDAEWYLGEIATDHGDLRDNAATLGLALERRELRNRRGLEGEDEQWELQLGGARLVWSGHAIRDVRVGSTRTMSFGYTGARNSPWLLLANTVPAQERDLIGALRVEGDGPLAMALKSSPIRAVGPIELGGTATMTFRTAVTIAP